MDYVDEKQIKATQVPHRTPSGAIKRKPPNPTPAAYQQPNGKNFVSFIFKTYYKQINY